MFIEATGSWADPSRTGTMGTFVALIYLYAFLLYLLVFATLAFCTNSFIPTDKGRVSNSSQSLRVFSALSHESLMNSS